MWSVIQALPTDFVRNEVISEFLTLKDVALLEVGVAQTKGRAVLYGIFKDLCISCDPTLSYDENILEWVKKRGILLTKPHIRISWQAPILPELNVIAVGGICESLLLDICPHCNVAAFCIALESCKKLILGSSRGASYIDTCCKASYGDNGPLPMPDLPDGCEFPALRSIDIVGLSDSPEKFLLQLARACPQLTSIATCGVTDELAVTLAGSFPHLQSVRVEEFQNTRMAGYGVLQFAKGCPDLRSLEIRTGKALFDATVQALAEVNTQLTALHLPCSSLTAVSLDCITTHYESLESLELHWKALQSQSSFSSLANLTSLTSLTVESVPGQGLSNAHLVMLPELLPGLRALKIGLTAQTSRAALLEITTNCEHLRDLELLHCCYLADTDFSALVEPLSALRSLRLQQARLLADAAVASIAAHCPSLEWFELSGCDGVTDASLRVLADTFAGTLRRAAFFTCHGLSEAGLLHLLQRCRRLRTLQVLGIEASEVREAVAERCRRTAWNRLP